MEIYTAINEMRRLTEQGIPFSVSFMSYSYSRNESHGVVTIVHAKLRKATNEEFNQFSDYMLQFYDCDTNEYKSCWQPLLLSFNDNELVLV